MKFFPLVVLAILVPHLAFGFETKISAANFGEAGKAVSFLRFDIPVRKLFFSSSETGFADKFEGNARIEGNRMSGARVEFEVHDLDTDLYARNDQMWNLCLGYKVNPKISVSLPAFEFVEGKPVAVSATMNVRGKDKSLPLEITLLKKNGKWTATGRAHTSFEALSIPDPSIGVAAVKGPIEISFHLEDQ